MSINAITVGQWQSTGNDAWTLTTQIPNNARIHLPCEDGRILTGQNSDAKPWGGSMRASCIGIELADTYLQLSLRCCAKYMLSVQAKSTDACIDLTLIFRNASYATSTAAPPPLVLSEHESMSALWQDYRQWMDIAWPTSPFFAPAWTQQIPAVVLVEMWTGKGTITHTFDDMVCLLNSMHESNVPENTLVYFWGFHAPFDTRYPEYWPARELGGERGMSKVVETARQFGYRLMPHLNYWGCDSQLPIFEQFQSHQVRDRHGVPQGWRMEGEPPIEYIRPSCTAWRNKIAEVCQRFVSHFPIDALFLDQLGFYEDDAACDFDDATQQYIETIQQACPNVALAGEIFHERCRSLPMWQVWGTPWCGLPVREDLEHATMWQELFGGDVTLLPHMGMPGAVPMTDSWPAYYWYVDHYGPAEATRRANQWHKQIGAVPSVRVNYRQHGIDDVALEILTGTSTVSHHVFESASH